MKRISLKLLKHVSDKEKKRHLEQSIKAAVLYSEALCSVLESDIEALNKELSDQDRFKNPSWEQETAYLLGKQAQLKLILQLLPKDS